MKRLKVIFFHRKPVIGSFSVEYIFNDVRSRLSNNIDSKIFQCRFISQGFIRRFINTIEASFNQGDVNHITGDIHFLNLFMSKRKTILTILDCVFMKTSSGVKKWILKTFWLTIPIMRSKYITAISEATKQEIIKFSKCNPDKIKVIPVAISNNFKSFTKEFNIIKPVLLHIGMAPNKNLLLLIEAIKGLNVHLSIVGKLSEEYKEKLISNSIDYSNVFGINDEEMIQKYIQCDILTFVSTYEGFGMPILEAQSTGRVVITSNISSMPEVAGEGALFVDPTDTLSIREGIIKLISDENLRKYLIEKGFENIKRYDPDRIANMYESLYAQISSEY